MNGVAWLDHDFAHEVTVEPKGWMRVGVFLDTDVYCPTDLDTDALPVSDSATADPGLPPPAGPGSSARAVDQRKAELLEELVDVLLTKPSQFYSYLIGELRRHHATSLSALPVEVLYSVVNRAVTLHGARGGR